MTTNPEDVKNAIDQALKDIFSDTRWEYVSKRHRYAEIEGVRVGVAFATNSKPQYENFALNCADMERLRAGNTAGNLDQLFAVATKINGTGQAEYRGHAEANTLPSFGTGRRSTAASAHFGLWTRTSSMAKRCHSEINGQIEIVE